MYDDEERASTDYRLVKRLGPVDDLPFEDSDDLRDTMRHMSLDDVCTALANLVYEMPDAPHGMIIIAAHIRREMTARTEMTT